MKKNSAIVAECAERILMKVTIDSFGLKHSVEIDSDEVNIYKVGRMLRSVLVSAGFMTDTIDKILTSDDELDDLDVVNPM